jgi:carbon starvation protein
VASRRFAPAGLIATPAEKALEREWAELPADRQPESVRH